MTGKPEQLADDQAEKHSTQRFKGSVPEHLPQLFFS
jgi:hypothetical protein